MDSKQVEKNSETIERIRKTMKDNHNNNREKQRFALLKTRRALGDFISDVSYTKEFILDRALNLKKKTLSIEDYQLLQNSLVQSEENINIFLGVDQIVFSLVRDLSSNNPVSQLYAANCCCNIALGNAKACMTLAKYISPYLVNELESLNNPLLEICAWTIGNLSVGSSKAFDTLYKQGAINILISLLTSCEDFSLPSVLYAITHCIYGGFNQIMEEEKIKIIEAVLKKNHSFRDKYFLWTLAFLSSSPGCQSHLHKFVPVIFENLFESLNQEEDFDIIVMTGLAHILANMISEPSGEIATILLNYQNYPNFLTVVNRMLQRDNDYINKELLWLLGNLYNHPITIISDRMKNDLSFLSSLQQISQSQYVKGS
ncbi:probable importin subunit alpha-A [Prorops nasuta]|uniref:probable importin subunit alpha-A n=1 Tax=Prorops nasuta TaxID=863751 RepID=UPI0034CFB40B